MMRQKRTIILMCIFVCTWVSTLFALPSSTKMTPNGSKEVMKVTEDKKILTDTIKVKKIFTIDSIKNKLIEETENYIFRKFPKTNKKLPSTIVENGLEHDIDILFMMAQTKVETCFGTAGAGRETSRRSLFGVANRRYSSYENAVEDYIAILKKSYLTRGRTEQHLMNKYTTTRGGRYATDPRYEISLRAAYSEINSKTSIKRLQKEYLMHKNANEL